MFDLDKWQEIYFTMSKHKLRTALTAFGVVWGILMLVLLLGFGRGLENGVKSIFGNLAKNATFIWGGKTVLPYEGLKPGRHITFNNQDYYAIKREIPEVKYITGGTSLWGTFIVSYQMNSGSFKVGGDLPELNQIRGVLIPEGRFINQKDVDEQRKVCVLGPRVIEVLFGEEAPIGKYINIKGVQFLVVGRFFVDGNDGRNEAEKIYIPLTTLQKIYNAPSRITSFAFVPQDGIDPEEVENKVKQFLAQRHKVSPEDKSAIGSWNSARESKQFTGLFIGINIFVWFVSIGTLIAGIVGVSNIMLIIVKERTKEIGLRKALGATPKSIISLVITESIVITSFAGYIGLVFGVAVLELLKYLLLKFEVNSPYFSNPEINISIALIALVILVIAGALAGMFPAVKAASIHPIEALRDE